MDIVNPEIETYMASLQTRHDEPVLLEMEAEGRERGFPIVGRNVGVTLEVLARSIGARRVMELGSGFGYTAYWFARAVGDRRRGALHRRRSGERRQGRGLPDARGAVRTA